MNKIDTKLLYYTEPDRICQLACEITRGANKFADVRQLNQKVDDFAWTKDKVIQTLSLPHSKLSRFIDLTFAVVGASRRFLAQITTHHVGVSIISGSLQYSNHAKQSLADKFVVPYELFSEPCYIVDEYLATQQAAMVRYELLVNNDGISNDTAGYVTPQSLRNCMLVKVNLEALRYIASQRLCHRNTDETKYVVAQMVKLACDNLGLPWEWFAPACYKGNCKEQQYCCGKPVRANSADEFLKTEFPFLYEE
jgi:thymidylate synthase (FAD)